MMRPKRTLRKPRSFSPVVRPPPEESTAVRGAALRAFVICSLLRAMPRFCIRCRPRTRDLRFLSFPVALKYVHVRLKL